MFVPVAPVAAYVLGVSGEAAVVGTATEAVIGGVISSGTEAFVTTTLKEISSNRSVGDKLRNIAGATGASALTSIPSSLMGANITTIFGQFVAEKTAGQIGGAASKGVDMAINALGVSDAAQQVSPARCRPTDRRSNGRRDHRDVAVAATGISMRGAMISKFATLPALAALVALLALLIRRSRSAQRTRPMTSPCRDAM